MVSVVTVVCDSVASLACFVVCSVVVCELSLVEIYSAVCVVVCSVFSEIVDLVVISSVVSVVVCSVRTAVVCLVEILSLVCVEFCSEVCDETVVLCFSVGCKIGWFVKIFSVVCIVTFSVDIKGSVVCVMVCSIDCEVGCLAVIC